MLLGLEPTRPSTVHWPCALGTNKEPRGSLARMIDGKQASGISLLRIYLTCTLLPASDGLSHQQKLYPCQGAASAGTILLEREIRVLADDMTSTSTHRLP